MQVLPNDSDGHDVEYRTFAFCVCSLNLHVNLALVRAFEINAIVPVRLHGRLNDGIFRFLFCNLWRFFIADFELLPNLNDYVLDRYLFR